MRIRDWTADVCSSDLAFLRRAAHRGVEFLARADDMVGDRDRGLGIAEQGFEALLAFEIAELGARFAIEIGRASWRASVCPYVEIPVVAGSFKENSPHTKSGLPHLRT